MSVKTPIRDLKDNYYLSVKATLNRYNYLQQKKMQLLTHIIKTFIFLFSI